MQGPASRFIPLFFVHRAVRPPCCIAALFFLSVPALREGGRQVFLCTSLVSVVYYYCVLHRQTRILMKGRHSMRYKTTLSDKLQESFGSVFPLVLIVSVVCFVLIPISVDLMLLFFIGALLLVAGMGLFTLGAETAMTPIGSLVGSRMMKTRKLWLVLLLSFLLGVAITVSEPDLQVLAVNVPHIDTPVLIVTVAVGVGLFLSICMLRILFRVSLRWLLIFFYAAIFALAFLSDVDYLGVAFDSGGVTTGPMTVPFIMAMGVGVASIRSDKNAAADSFGLVALCSIGPILAVMGLSFLYDGSAGTATATQALHCANTVELGMSYLSALPEYLKEMALALLPIAGFFLLFHCFALHLQKRLLKRILIGLLYTYAGLVLFLTGINVGFSSLGFALGGALAQQASFLLIPLSMLLGWYIISAEPAVHVLNRQVEEVSAGAISARAMGISLSIGVSAAMGLSMLRVLTGLPVLWLLLPGYAAALALSFFVPPIFTAIAFDSGGVASGPMTAAFMLPFCMGVSQALGGNLVTDAFGVVALVAMMPLITIQLMGAVYVLKTRRGGNQILPEAYDDFDIIELWEVA